MSLVSSSPSRIRFSVVATDPWSGARATVFETLHGVVETPIFMPVATHAALRGVDTSIAESIGSQVLLANTYHLLLHPGPEVFLKFGGIHPFMKWPRTVLTDSGGFQIFSLSRSLQMSEEGARFRSYRDGAQVLLTPEVSIQTQRAIGSDIMMVLDHCIDSTSDVATTRAALELTTRWARRSYAARGDSPQALFGIVQGACYPELRRESAAQITDIPFDGYALGGLAVGETKSEREDVVEYTAQLLPKDRPRYLMGVGTPIDLLEAVKRGVDMFDCIIPTSLAHQGIAFTSGGKIDLGRGAFKASEEPLDRECQCSTCVRFSRAYLHHLLCAKEYLVDQLVGVHNLTFYQTLMSRMRRSIIEGSFKDFYARERERLVAKDDECPETPPRAGRASKGARVERLGDFEIVESSAGYGSIKQISSGEVMHSVVDPGEEAFSLYYAQSKIGEIVKVPGDELIVWDVGLGAATNAMTCILKLQAAALRNRAVHLYSFEKDLDPLILALKKPGLFRHLRHGAPHCLLRDGEWISDDGSIVWRLIRGDFERTRDEAPPPEIIWYDPFSFKVDTALWGVDAFEKLLARCQGKSSRLYTYTASTAVRAAMLAAGWYVGAGTRTGPKRETTIAYSTQAAVGLPVSALLGNDWLQRWTRSDAQQPFGATSVEARERVRLHPQFS